MASSSFDQALAFVLRWEGGFVNNPKDPGGATNRGVTQKVYDAWRDARQQPRQGVAQIGDDEVRAIYEANYWAPAKCDALGSPLDLVQFDTAVNMGVGRAIRFLQGAVGAEVDGGFGPGTQKCLDACDRGQALAAFCGQREAFYRQIVAAKPEQQVFLAGWLNRLNALRQRVGLPVLQGVSGDADVGGRVERVADVAEDSPEGIRQAKVRSVLLTDELKRNANPDDALLQEARALVLTLRNVRSYEAMTALAESLCRIDPGDATTRRLYAQGLIERGMVTVAVDVLVRLKDALPPGDPEVAEAWGLLGRAYKQMFFDAPHASTAAARASLVEAIDAYRHPWELDPERHTWHGVNLLALVARARRENWRTIAPYIDPAKLSAQLMTILLATADSQRDEWTLPTIAEVSLGQSLATGNLAIVEEQLTRYLQDPALQAFQVASTLRQFVEVWGLEALTLSTPGTSLPDEAAVRRARRLVDILRARLLSLPGGELTFAADKQSDILQVASPPRPDDGQLEAILGTAGPETYRWWCSGVAAARSVGAVHRRNGQRFGTGFLVSSRDLGLTMAPDELLFMTNHHIINPKGDTPGAKPQDVEVLFEADGSNVRYAVSELLWTSPIEAHDASLVRLRGLPADAKPLPVSVDLPVLVPPGGDRPPRVYVIGYPGGRELSFSFQDNELLDHEGPPSGRPSLPGVCRVHYTAPTEGGNSGSPVFEDQQWRVIALHHRGGKFMPRLNDGVGTYPANEGLGMGAMLAALRAEIVGAGPAAGA